MNNELTPVQMPIESVTQPYKPTNQEALREYEVHIQFMNRGGVVRVGCKSIPFESTENMLAELQEYFTNCYETQEKWRKILV